jgi:hypothetical protein
LNADGVPPLQPGVPAISSDLHFGASLMFN